MVAGQLLDIPLGAGGLADQIDSRVLPPGQFVTMKNLVVSKSGSVVKRNGYGLVELVDTDSEDVTNVQWIGGHKKQTLAIREKQADYTLKMQTRSPAKNKWVDLDRISGCTIKTSPVVRSGTGAYAPKSCKFGPSNGGYILYVWVAGISGTRKTYFKVVDATTGAELTREKTLFTSDTPSCVFSVGQDAFVVAIESGALVTFRIAGADLTQTTGTTVAAVNQANTFFDASPMGGTSTYFLLAYVDRTADPTKIWLAKVSASTLAVSSSTSWVHNSVYALSVCGDTSKAIWVSHIDDNAGTFLPHCSTRSASTLASISTNQSLGGSWYGLFSITNAVDYSGSCLTMISGASNGMSTNNNIVSCLGYMDSTGAVTTVIKGTWRTFLNSRPFLVGRRMYAILLCQAGVLSGAGVELGHNVLFCLDDGAGNGLPFTLVGVVSRFDGNNPLFVPPSRKTHGFAHSYDPADTAKKMFCYDVATSFVAIGGERNNAGDKCEIDFAYIQPGLWNTADAQECLLLSGGLTQQCDGQAVFENGFLQAPLLWVTDDPAGVPQIDTGKTYLYMARYEWKDAQGNLHVGPFSTPYAYTPVNPPATRNNKVYVQCTGVTQKGRAEWYQREIYIALYRTKGDTPEVFYRLAPYGEATVKNDRTLFETTFQDSHNDTNLEWLYDAVSSSGEPIEAQAPPPSLAMVVHKNRAWLVSGNDQKAVWYSREFVRSEPPCFADEFTIRVDDSPEGITALASLDDKLVIFTATRIYYVVGDGPNAVGGDGIFSNPQLVAANFGCINARSTQSFRDGVIFLSANGLQLLDRGLGISYIGEAVKDTVTNYPICRGSAHHKADQRLIWLLTNSSASASVFVVYDYHHKIWSTWTMSAYATQYAHAVVDDKHHVADVLGVARESYGSYPGFDNTDDPNVPSWITSELETGWIHLWAINGFGRVRHVMLSGQNDFAGSVTMKLYQDEALSPSQSYTFNLETSGTLVERDRPLLDMHVRVQKCRNIKIKITDETIDGTSYAAVPVGPTWAGLTLEWIPRQGRARAAATNKAGENGMALWVGALETLSKLASISERWAVTDSSRGTGAPCSPAAGQAR